VNLEATVRRIVAPLVARARLAVARAVVRLVDDARALQTLQVQTLAGETLGRVERFQEYGFTSHPPASGSEGVVVFALGARDNPLAIAVEHRASRPKGATAAGEVLLYNGAGVRVLLRNDGAVVVTAAGGLEASADVEAGGDVRAAGDVEDGVGTLAALRTAYNMHTHPDPQGGSTGPPVPTV
jgi:phage baseplate assembly protein V